MSEGEWVVFVVAVGDVGEMVPLCDGECGEISIQEIRCWKLKSSKNIYHGVLFWWVHWLWLVGWAERSVSSFFGLASDFYLGCVRLACLVRETWPIDKLHKHCVKRSWFDSDHRSDIAALPVTNETRRSKSIGSRESAHRFLLSVALEEHLTCQTNDGTEVWVDGWISADLTEGRWAREPCFCRTLRRDRVVVSHREVVWISVCRRPSVKERRSDG